MVATRWTYEQAKRHYFMYFERVGSADLLHELRASPVTMHADAEKLASTLYRNLKATAHAATAPLRTAMLAAHTGRASSIQQLLEHAATTKDQDVLKSAAMLLQDAGAFIDESLETLRVIHERNFMPEAFQSLLRQGTAMTWGAFETFCFDLFRLLFTRNLSFLRAIVTAQTNSTPWSGTPKKLLEWIESAVAANPSLSNEAAYDSFKGLPSMQLRATRHFSGVLFPGHTVLLSLLDAPELVRLSARRHLLMHAAGVIDDKYLASTGEPLPIGSDLVVTPRDLALGFRAVSSAGATLAQAAASVL